MGYRRPPQNAPLSGDTYSKSHAASPGKPARSGGASNSVITKSANASMAADPNGIEAKMRIGETLWPVFEKKARQANPNADSKTVAQGAHALRERFERKHVGEGKTFSPLSLVEKMIGNREGLQRDVAATLDADGPV